MYFKVHYTDTVIQTIVYLQFSRTVVYDSLFYNELEHFIIQKTAYVAETTTVNCY